MELSTRDRRVSVGLWVAGALSAAAWWSRRNAKRAEKQFPPAGNFVEVDGVRLHYIERGSGAPVLLLHGNGTRAEDFAGCGLLDRLAAHYRVIAFDRPGFGFSTRPRSRVWTPAAQARLLDRACEMLGAERPIVVGHSFGTLVALALALDRESLVRGLVLVSGYYFPTLRLDSLLGAGPAIPLIGDVMRYTVSPLIGKLIMRPVLRNEFSPRQVDPRFVASVPQSLMLRPWQLRAAAEDGALMVPATAELSRHYREISVPVEIFAGIDDKHAKQQKQSLRLHDEIARSTLHMIPGEGHMLHYDMSAEIAQAVDRIAVSTGLAPTAAMPVRAPA
ncbi:MAG TPA: alpha/beta hydrolase [Aromatoleum sp.]|uniref:alpha/beta fold hydrolase n=1 Tax=Aromatoleum sp. TaxID=2307007 RepID=UPI002B492FA3|nr:alpha/beta hydrolase [Aromatoleum sp.]HJV25608.1 alpha/beta hydrolase [Aromatoleum sp.]